VKNLPRTGLVVSLFEGNATKQATSTTGGWHGAIQSMMDLNMDHLRLLPSTKLKFNYQSNNVPWGSFKYGSSLVIQLVQD
jgi:hypothetical protein